MKEPFALVYTRRGWGWLAWTAPGRGQTAATLRQVGILSSHTARRNHVILRWLTRRPARRITVVSPLPGPPRISSIGSVLVSSLGGLIATARGAPVGVALLPVLLAPLVTEHVPDQLDAWARMHVRIVENDSSIRLLQRLGALQTHLLQAAARSKRYEVRRSAEVGQHLLWEAAGLLQTRTTPTAAARLIAYERMMLQLARQVAQLLDGNATSSTAGVNHAPGPRSFGHCRQLTGWPATDRPAPHAASQPRQKGAGSVLQSTADQHDPAGGVHLLFAHEPYHPVAGREINTTVVPAAVLLHPRVHQPDGTRIHERLVRGRQPGEIVPLSTLTHELGGGTRWSEVGDWEAVTKDVLQLVRNQDCDALGLCLPALARALVCAGPNSTVRVLDPHSGSHQVHGPADRIAVLAVVRRYLAWAEAGSPLWPGDDPGPPCP
ncbi:hypothetical protein [Streptomyces sp. NPDC094468]|uniref:hypothetical protein n=1 Tax=Streptomyces sp. NPDC094468 TaxID=3366066 RepID=UPI00382E0F18